MSLLRRRTMMVTKSPKPEQPIGINLIDASSVINNYYLSTTGELVESLRTRTTDFIPVYFGNSYQKNTPGNRKSRMAVYDINKQFKRVVEYGNTQVSKSFSPEEGDAFIRLSASETGSGGSTTFEFIRTA